MKIAVCSYSFCSLVNKGGAQEKDLPALAKEMGFDAFEFSGINVPEDMDKFEYARLLRSEADKAGIPIVQYSVGADFYYGCDGDLQKEIERLKEDVDIAEILGVQGMRHDTCGGPREGDSFTFEDVLPRIIEGCRQVTEYAATKGIKTMTENHGLFCQDSVRVQAIVEGVNNKNFGTLVDIGNFLCADENPVSAVERMAPYAFYVHGKDFYIREKAQMLSADGFFQSRGGKLLKGSVLGHGEVPVLKCFEIIKNSGYDGYVTLEFEGAESSQTGVLWGLNTLKNVKKALNW